MRAYAKNLNRFAALISAASSAIGALALVVATWLAAHALSDYRKQQQIERRIDHAESILTASYKASDAIQSVARPVTPREMAECGERKFDVARISSACLSKVYRQRLSVYRDTLKDLRLAKALADGLFGAKVTGGVEEILGIFESMDEAANDPSKVGDLKTSPFMLAQRRPYNIDREWPRRLFLAVIDIESGLVPEISGEKYQRIIL